MIIWLADADAVQFLSRLLTFETTVISVIVLITTYKKFCFPRCVANVVGIRCPVR